jgi:hypothetical protein
LLVILPFHDATSNNISASDLNIHLLGCQGIIGTNLGLM